MSAGKLLWNIGGFLSLGMGLVGVVVPGLPTTVFLIIALGCFVKGANEKQVQWLLNHPRFGPTLRDWVEHQAISRRIKVIAVSAITISCGLSAAFATQKIWVKGAIIGLGLVGIVYILTRKTRENCVEIAPANLEEPQVLVETA